MNLTVALLLLATISQAAELKTSSRSTQKKEDESKTDKRALEEGNAGVEKRAPVLPTVLPSVTPGIEYADTKDLLPEKSPTHQIYATPPVPQIAKFSDVLTGQGPHFQAAIDSHLYSPVSVYQARLSSPTTYEVSTPVASQLAYTENISYQPQNPLQYTPQIYQKPQLQQQASFARFNYQQPQLLQQPILYQQQVIPQIYRQIPQIYQQPYQNQLQYSGPQVYSQNLVRQQLRLAQNVQSGIVRAQEQDKEQNRQPTIQRIQQNAQEPIKQSEKQIFLPEQNYNAQPQGAVSYASFSLGPPSSSQIQHQYQSQPQYQPQTQSQPQPQYLTQSQPQHQPPQPQYQTQSQHQHQQPQLQYKSQPQLQFQTQPLPQYINLRQLQPQYPAQAQYQSQQPIYQTQTQSAFPVQNQLQYVSAKLEPSPANSISVPAKALPVDSGRQVAYLRPVQNQVYQPQGYSGQILLETPSGYGAQAVTPSFPPVQYFGKFAQAIFGGYHQQ